MTKTQVDFSKSTHFSPNFPILDTANYSDDHLLAIYETRIQEYCDHFNSAILPNLIDQFSENIKNSAISDYKNSGKLCQSVINASDTQNYQHFYINTNAFSFCEEYSITVMGSFLNFHLDDNPSTEFDDIQGVNNYFSQHDAKPVFLVNMLMMRLDIHQYLTEVAGHEFAHAIVYFYHEMIKGCCDQEIGKAKKEIDLHGDEWSQMATLLYVSPSVTHDSPSLDIDSYRALHHCYNRQEYWDKGIYPLSIMENLHICPNGHIHDVNDMVRREIKNGIEYQCIHCNEAVIPFNDDIDYNIDIDRK